MFETIQFSNLNLVRQGLPCYTAVVRLAVSNSIHKLWKCICLSVLTLLRLTATFPLFWIWRDWIKFDVWNKSHLSSTPITHWMRDMFMTNQLITHRLPIDYLFISLMSSIVTTVVPCAGTKRRSGQGRVKNGDSVSFSDRWPFNLSVDWAICSWCAKFVFDVSNLYFMWAILYLMWAILYLMWQLWATVKRLHAIIRSEIHHWQKSTKQNEPLVSSK